MGGEGVSYTYRGNHQGPDLFDEPIIRGAYPSAYDEITRQEREAACKYWYARGYVDHEIGAQVGMRAQTVGDWRRRNGLTSNYELIIAL